MSPAIPRLCIAAVFSALLAGCAAPRQATDYDAFRQAQPHSIVVLPPLNESPEVRATYSVLAQATEPLAEAGYYVLPVALVDETFRQNGLTAADDIHAVPAAKLREIFGADTALYMQVKQYGTSYMIFKSATVVTANARLVDLKTGNTLWTGAATASNDEGGNNGGGLIGMLVTAAITQVINSVTEAAHPVAGLTSARLLAAGRPGGLPYGPRSPKYRAD